MTREECAGHPSIIQDAYYGQFNPESSPSIKPEDVIQLHTQPSVIFVAACATQDAFIKLWDIQTGTKNRALIIPQTNLVTNVDLSWGATAWIAILDSLLKGNSVGDAVKAGNAAATGSQYLWQIIGDASVKLVSTKSN